MGLSLERVPSFAAGVPLARELWREQGGLLVLRTGDAVTDALLDAAGDGALLDREALTFNALRSSVAAAAGEQPAEAAAPISVRLGLRELLAQVDLGPFGASAEAPGFLPAIEGAIDELRGARVPPERVREAAVDPVGHAVADVYERAWNGVALASDTRWLAADAADRLDAFPAVTVSGFDDLAPDMWALLRALGRVAPVAIVIPFRPDRDAFEARRLRHERWVADADRVHDHTPPAATGPDALARRLFDDGPPLAGPPPVALVGAAGTRGMLRTALEEVLAAHRAGLALSDVALVVPRLADQRDGLERLLDDWDVPARRASRVRVLEAPLALALTHLLHLGELEPEEPGALDHLLGWLRTPYSGAAMDEVDRFEVHARRGRLGGRGELMARWEGAAIAPARRLVAAAYQGPRAQIAALLEHGWAALRRASAGRDLPSRADRRDRGALAALAGLAGALDDEVEAATLPRGPLPPGVLGDLVADLTFLEQDGPAGGLHVHDLASIRGREYELVVIAGLDGDGVPSGPAPDALIGSMRAPLADLLPPRAPGTSEARLRFVHALGAARGRAVLVRRAVDDQGRELAPSPYWVEVARLCGRSPDELHRRTGARGEVVEVVEVAPTEREALRALALGGRVAPGPLAVAAARRRRDVGLAPGAFDDVTHLRVTAIESFLRCPYGWLHGSYLHPQPIEEPLDPRFEGTLAHDVLEAVYARMRDEDVGPVTPATLRCYRDALAEALPEVAELHRPSDAGSAYDALIEKMARHLAAMLGREAALGSRMLPTLIEERVEDRLLLGDLTPPFVVSGRPDRLDVTRDGAHSLVIDYKRSGSPFRLGSEDVTDRLQLPLYGVMARNAGMTAAEPAGGLYVGILAPDINGAVRDDVPEAPQTRLVAPEEWERAVSDATAAARLAGERIRAGELGPPREGRCSHWCTCRELWR